MRFADVDCESAEEYCRYNDYLSFFDSDWTHTDFFETYLRAEKIPYRLWCKGEKGEYHVLTLFDGKESVTVDANEEMEPVVTAEHIRYLLDTEGVEAVRQLDAIEMTVTIVGETTA